jgi:C-terminal processing protease CtpA/Prc
MRLTIAKYYTPNGSMIQREPKTGKGGIEPDVEIKLSKDEELKLYEGMQEIYYPDKSKEKNKKEINDKAIEKAMEVFKMMEVIKERV